MFITKYGRIGANIYSVCHVFIDPLVTHIVAMVFPSSCRFQQRILERLMECETVCSLTLCPSGVPGNDGDGLEDKGPELPMDTPLDTV